jgi:hypothetical protein
MRWRGVLQAWVAPLCMIGLVGCFGGPGDDVGGYDGTVTDTFTANGKTTTEQRRETIYLLEAEEGVALYLPYYDCVLESGYDGGELKVKGQRCSKAEEGQSFELRFNGDGEATEGELELDLSYSGTVTVNGQAIEVSGTLDFNGDLL